VGPNQVVATDDTDTTAAQAAVTTDVRANDTTLTGQPLAEPTVTLDAADGTTTVNPDGTITYSPAAGFSGTDEYVYRVCDTSDPVPICDTATVIITVTNVFIDGGVDITTPQNTPVTTPLGDIVTTKGEPVDPTSVGQHTAPQHGGIVIDAATGAVMYTPASGYTGPDVYVIDVCDTATQTPACDTATVHITVLPDKVVVRDQDVTTRVNNPIHHIDVLSDATSASGQPLQDPTIGTAPTHGTATVNPDGSITYTPEPDYVGTDAFTFTVCDTGDPRQACDTGTIRVTVTPVADLSITKKLDTADIVAGRAVTYTTTLHNLGPSAATNLHSIDPIRSIVTNPMGTPDPGVQHGKCVTRATTSRDLYRLSANFGPYTLAEYPKVVDCTYRRIAAGASVDDTITGTVAPDSPRGTVVNQAAVLADTYDPDLTNNLGIAKGKLATGADLMLTKRVDDRSVSVGDEVTFRITVTNHGPSSATAVQAQDTPTGMSFVSSQASQGSYDDAAGVWHIGPLAPGRTVWLTTVEKVSATNARNVAIVDSRTLDPHPGNNGGGNCTYGARGCGSVDMTVSGESSSNPPSGGNPPDGSGSPPSSGGTADTGVNVRMLCLLGGSLLAAGGALLLAARRRAA
jgi:uncharacterized repeat protein (TIGR01451 family)